MGPISLRPTHGAGWAQRKRARTVAERPSTAATASATWFGAFDVHADRLRLRLRDARRGSRHARLHAHDPLLPTRARTRIYWIQDGLSGQLDPRHPRVRRRTTTSSSSRPPPTPATSTASRRTSAPINEFVVKNADYLDWDAFAHALARHIHHRNGPDRDRRITALERKLTIAA